MSLPVLPAAELVEDREQENYLVSLIQQEESVVLNVLQHLVVLPQTLAHLVVVFELGTLEVLGVVFELAVEQVALEVVLLVVLDQPHGVVDQFLPLPELAGVDDDQILAEVQLADILREGPVHGQSQGQLSLNLLLQVSGDFMLEEFLPAEAVFGIGPQHLFDQLFRHIRNGVDGSREVVVLLVYHYFELVDVLGVVGRTESQAIIPSEEHPVVANPEGVHICLVAVL